MATLGELKTDIADILDRDDLSAQIGDAITRAIARYQQKPWWFQDRRDLLITTVGDTSRYASFDAGSAVSSVGAVARFRDAWSYEAGTASRLRRFEPREWEDLVDNGAAKGQPYNFAWLNDEILVYPIPDDDSYELRFHALVRMPGPATDGETNNVWMDHAYRLIRAEAVRELAAIYLRDPRLAETMAFEVDREDATLVAEGNKLRGTGRLARCD